MDETTIRKANKADIRQIVAIGLQFLNQHQNYSDLDVFEKPRTLREEIHQWKKLISDKKKNIFVAEKNGEILGFMIVEIQKRWDVYKVKRLTEIVAMSVKEGYFNKGIGTALFNKAIEFSKSKEIDYIHANVRLKNPALEFAKKLGFEQLKFDTYPLKTHV